jgi:small subunit ribosomal protein S16
MVRIRLRRIGSKRQPSYRIVAIEKEAPRDSDELEILGFYNPRTHPETITLKEDRIYVWMKNGAQPSDSALKVFQSAGLMARYERYKKGESTENLLEEARNVEAARNINPKTTRLGSTKG